MLDRQIYKAIHELERVQKIRRGESFPASLAIDVDLPQHLKMGSFRKIYR